MKYFIDYKELPKHHSSFHEFYKGKWDEKTFWNCDSMYIHDDYFFYANGLIEAISTFCPEYNPYGETTITEMDWAKIGNIVSQKDDLSKQLYAEISQWLSSVFPEYGCFTILGI